MALGLTDKKYIRVIKNGTTYDCVAVNVIKGGVASNVWMSGSSVIYVVDADTTYQEDVRVGDSVLSPTSFTPSKDGWTFVGWREDGAATSEVLTEKVMTGDPVILYAVFKQTVTATFISHDNTKTVDGTMYYNALGTITGATITAVEPAEYPGWVWRGWSAAGDTVADASVAYASGSTISGLTGNVTYNGLYQADVILTTVVNSVSTEHKKIKYHSASGTNKNPQFTVADPAVENYIFQGWSLQPSGEEVEYADITNITLSSNLTVYAIMRLNVVTVYDATYNWPEVGYTSNPPKTVHVNDTTYVSTAGEVGATIGGDTNDNHTYTTPDQILLILSAAAANFKYADITFEYFTHADYGEAEAYIDGTLVGKHDGTNKVYTKTVTWEIAEKIKCTGRVRLVDKSSGTTYWFDGFVGVKKVVLREWTGVTSYIVNFLDYPITKTSSSLDHGNGTSSVSTTASWYSISIKKNKDSGGTGYIKASVALPTQGCNKVSITYACYSSSGAVINNSGNLLSGWTSYKEDTITLSCSGDTFNLNLESYDATGDNTASLEITKIRFYTE